MRAMIRATALGTSILILIGCGDHPARQALSDVSRSAGDPRIRLEIPGTAPNGDLWFASAAGATRLSDGTIVIGDRLDKKVRFFDGEGNPHKAVGREGRGPGEFDDIDWLGQCGSDSVFAWDFDLKRMTVIDAEGSVVTTFPLPDDPSVAAPWVVACSRNGVVAFIGMPENTGHVWQRYYAPLSLADTRGAVMREIGEVAAFEGRPLGKITSMALTPDRIYVGTKDSAFVDVYSLEGRLLGTIAVGNSMRAPTPEHYERAIDIQVMDLGSISDREALKELMLGWPMPEFLPPYAALMTDPDGLLWIQISLPGDAETWLRAIDSEGGVVTDVHIPFFMAVFEVGREDVLGTYEDEDGEPVVVVYEK